MSDDDVRDAILEYLWKAWKNPRGMDSHKLKISQITADLKKKGIEKKIRHKKPTLSHRNWMGHRRCQGITVFHRKDERTY